MAEIGLAEVVHALRSELEAAMAEGKGQRIRFTATDITLEFQVGVTRAAELSGGLKFWVVEWGTQASRSAESVQKVTLSLKPSATGGHPFRIAAASDDAMASSSEGQQT